MSEFLKGGDLTVEIGGEVVGGITSVKIEEANDFYYIKEFLYGKSVYSVSSQAYELTLTMCIADGGDFSSADYIDYIAVSKGSAGVRYNNCRVLSVADAAEENETLVRTVKLRSEEKEDF